MDAQLRLIPRTDANRSNATSGGDHQQVRRSHSAEAPVEWRIDESARRRGKEGISLARQALRQARQPLPRHDHTTAA